MVNIECNDPEIIPSTLFDVARQFALIGETENLSFTVTLKGNSACAELADKKAFAENAESPTFAAKLALYKLLCEITGERHAWGSLSGVKPLKILIKLYEKGYSRKQAESYFKNNFAISDEKFNLLCRCAENQREMLYPKDSSYALYLHVPLCLSKCSYCSFPSALTECGSALCASYLSALLKELEEMHACFAPRKADCIYIGGGTPSVLSSEQITTLLEHLKTLYPKAKELMFEAGRADTLTDDKLKALKQGGVSRLSLNPQTTSELTLSKLNRKVSLEDFLRCFERVRKAGFDNVNCDIIFGLENENKNDFRKSLSDIASLEPESITLHTLCKKHASELNADTLKQNKLPIASFMNEAASFLEAHGYEPYYLYRQKNALDNAENIGFAKKGRGCIYNVRMMGERQSVVSAGASSTTKLYFPKDDSFKNVYNLKNIELYINGIDEVIEKKVNRIKQLNNERG